MVELCTLGGYNEVGKNMIAVKSGNDAVIFDMGFHMQRIVDFEEEGGHKAGLTANHLIKLDAVPDDGVIASWRHQVKAIALSHCHLDHIGAVPYLAKHYNAPIYGTPFTMSVLNRMMRDDDLSLPNNLVTSNTGKIIKLTNNISIEFIHVTHSTPHSTFIALHTKEGVILYATDFKFDNHPVIGNVSNYDRIKELRDEGVIALFVDSLYSKYDGKMPSEKVAREMLKDVLLGTDNDGSAIIGTCFASHIARLKSFIDFGKKLDRRVVFLGRSMMKYADSANQSGIIDLSKQAQIVGYRQDVKRTLRQIEKQGAQNYLILCSGGQGEPNSVLNRMLEQHYPFKFMNEDQVIFSNKVIPVEPNIANRKELEHKLTNIGARIFRDIHVSGHGGKEDIRDLINMVEPQHIIPCHGPHSLMEPAENLAESMGYKAGKDVHLARNGQKIKI